MIDLVNPFGLDTTSLLLWGLIAHVVADWFAQNDWIAAHKHERRTPAMRPGDGMMTPPRMYQPSTRWWDRHPAAYVHAFVHAVLLAPVFGVVSLPIAVVHLLIDTRTPIVWWGRVFRQTQPRGHVAVEADAVNPDQRPYRMEFDDLTVKVRRVDDDGREVDADGEPISEVELLRRELEDLKRDMREWTTPVFDVGNLVRMAVDQVAHIETIALAALITGALT